MATSLWVDTAHPANAGVLRSMGLDCKAVLIAAPDSVIGPYLNCGSHPDVVERVWDQLGAAVPIDSRCLLCGTPALVHPKSGVILVVSYGTEYTLRIPVDAIGEALKAGVRTTVQWSVGDVTDIRREFGPDWIFGHYLSQELQWCRTVYDAMDRPANSSVGAESGVTTEV
jgi:hypothetical protein